MHPVVSVIMPLYNSEKYVEEAIQSVLHQTFQNFELLLIDDSSSDDTLKIAKQFKDKRIRIIEHERNIGVSGSRNDGIKVAVGDYLAMMDDDDIMPKTRLEKQVAFLEANNQYDAVGGKIWNIDENGNIQGVWNSVVLNNFKYIRAKLLQCGVFINGCMTYRTKSIRMNDLWFENDMYGLEDYDFMVHLSKVGKITGIDDPVLWYRRHGENTEKKILDNYYQQRREVWKRIYKYSYKTDGFELSDQEYETLLEGFNERREEPLSHEEFGKFLLVLANIEKQMKMKHPIHEKELTIWMNQCRRDLC